MLDDLLPDEVLRDIICALNEIRRGYADGIRLTRTDGDEWDVETIRRVRHERHSE